MSDPFLAEIRTFGFTFAPSGWALCNGQLLPIQQNTALFSLLGTTYGGNGTTTFALPDLRGRAPMQPGTGPGLSNHVLGESGGSETVTLLEAEMPAHTHALRANVTDPGDTSTPGPAASFAASSGGALYQASADTELDPSALGGVGGSQPHNNLQPYLVVNYCIALQGEFPSRP